MRNWIALFSRSGSEIGNIWKKTGLYPSIIYTNKSGDYAEVFNEMVRAEPIELKICENCTALFEELSNEHASSIITLHGFLKIVPDSLCSKFEMYNGHPGNITRYSELKGINPQMKAFKLKHSDIGGIIHKVVPEVDSGEILIGNNINYTHGLDSEEDYFNKLSDIMLNLWVEFLKGLLMSKENKAIKPDHYNKTKISCIEAIEMITDHHQNDVFIDHNRFQAFKYLWRLGEKDDILQELEKAKQFLDFAINKLKNKPITGKK